MNANDIKILNQEVRTLFQQTTQSNIYHLDFEFCQSLENFAPKSLDREQSVKIMNDLIAAVFYLKTNKLNPCQIKFSYVGCDQQRNWGLKHAICYRVMNPPKQPDAYQNIQFLYHSNQENQLIWNLGKIWLRFYTTQKITTIDMQQAQINDAIDKAVANKQINKVLKRLLTIKKQHRISFQNFLADDVFVCQNSPMPLLSTIFMHFNNFSSNVEKVTNSLVNKNQINTPYEEQIFRRDLQESLEICYLLQKCIALIKSLYQKGVDIQFTAYCLMKRLDEKKISNRIIDYTLAQKKVYSDFVRKMLSLKVELQKKMKMPMFAGKDGLNQNQRKYLVPPEKMDASTIHKVFKIAMVEYISTLQNDFKAILAKKVSQETRNADLCKVQRRCLLMLLGRLCNQIFSELRTHIYEQFLEKKGLKIFKISQFLEYIDNCKDPVSLKQIRKSIYSNGLQGLHSNKKITQQK